LATLDCAVILLLICLLFQNDAISFKNASSSKPPRRARQHQHTKPPLQKHACTGSPKAKKKTTRTRMPCANSLRLSSAFLTGLDDGLNGRCQQSPVNPSPPSRARVFREESPKWEQKRPRTRTKTPQLVVLVPRCPWR